MQRYLSYMSVGLLCLILFSCRQTVTEEPAPPRPAIIDPNPDPAWLSPEESMKTMHLPPGYHLQLVASEPVIREPVVIVWDGNGRMYVAEMRSYMQDINGTGERLPICRITRLEDTDGDGKMDKSTVFLDSLVLPRMMLAVGDRLVVNETYTYNLYSYRDTNGDGKADEKTVKYPDVMPAQAEHTDEYIASVLSFIRVGLGNNGGHKGLVRPEDVKEIRAKNAARKEAWTMEELDGFKKTK